VQLAVAGIVISWPQVGCNTANTIATVSSADGGTAIFQLNAPTTVYFYADTVALPLAIGSSCDVVLNVTSSSGAAVTIDLHASRSKYQFPSALQLPAGNYSVRVATSQPADACNLSSAYSFNIYT
jgi:hypothetical protein